MKKAIRHLNSLTAKAKAPFERVTHAKDESSEPLPMLVAGIVLFIAFISLYTYQLGSLLPAGGGEIHAIQSANSVSDLARNPLLLPFKLIAFVLIQLPFNDLLAVRLASVSIAFMSGVLFFLLARRWYGDLNSYVVTLLFITSGWMLHTGRYGAAFGVLSFTVLALLQFFAWMNHAEKPNKVVLCGSVVGLIAFFTPGGIWLLLAGTLVCRKTIIQQLKKSSTASIIVASALTAGGLALLTVAILRDPAIWRQWVGLPDDTPTLIVLVKQALTSITSFTIRGPSFPEVWLAHTPVLDVACSILLLTGALFYARHMRNTRTLLMLALFTVGVVLVMFNSSAALGYLAPIFYLVIASGLAYFMHQWRKVFPKNPIARSVSIVFVGIAVVSIMAFHFQRYFIAWRYSPDTVQAYADAKQGTNPTPYLIQ
jgi:hypothetical protein